MNERILELVGEGLKLVLEMSLGVAGDETDVVQVIALDLGVLIAFFVLLEELGKLLVVHHFLLLHWHYLLDVCLERSQIIHQDLLLLLELDDIGVVFGNPRFRKIQVGDADVPSVEIQQVIGCLRLHRRERLRNVLILRPEEYLHLGRPTDDWRLTQPHEESVQEMLSLLDEELLHFTRRLLRRDGRYHHAGVTRRQLLVEGEELGVAATDMDRPEAIVPFDVVHRELSVPSAFFLRASNGELHDAVIALVAGRDFTGLSRHNVSIHIGGRTVLRVNRVEFLGFSPSDELCSRHHVHGIHDRIACVFRLSGRRGIHLVLVVHAGLLLVVIIVAALVVVSGVFGPGALVAIVIVLLLLLLIVIARVVVVTECIDRLISELLRGVGIVVGRPVVLFVVWMGH